jgi:hypothetical protein
MRRGITALAIAAGLALAVASPVAAWSSIAVDISGGDNGGTVSVTGDVMAPELLVTPPLDSRPTGELGDRFSATYTSVETGRVIAVQVFYPYAKGGPVAYTAAAGTIGSHSYAAGWRQADPSVLDDLVARGLPAPHSAPDLNRESVSGRSPGTASASRGGGPLLAIALGSLFVLALATILTGTRRLAADRRAA